MNDGGDLYFAKIAALFFQINWEYQDRLGIDRSSLVINK